MSDNLSGYEKWLQDRDASKEAYFVAQRKVAAAKSVLESVKLDLREHRHERQDLNILLRELRAKYKKTIAKENYEDAARIKKDIEKVTADSKIAEAEERTARIKVKDAEREWRKAADVFLEKQQARREAKETTRHGVWGKRLEPILEQRRSHAAEVRREDQARLRKIKAEEAEKAKDDPVLRAQLRAEGRDV